MTLVVAEALGPNKPNLYNMYMTLAVPEVLSPNTCWANQTYIIMTLAVAETLSPPPQKKTPPTETGSYMFYLGLSLWFKMIWNDLVYLTLPTLVMIFITYG